MEMKDAKFKKVESNKYSLLSENCKDWVNKYCNNGTASLKGLRGCYSWKDAYIVLCKNVYMSISRDLFKTLWKFYPIKRRMKNDL